MLIDGSLTLLSPRYFEMMRRTFWDSKLDQELFPGKYGYFFNKYARPVRSVIVGVGALLFALFAFK